jgi:retron-type reverse transcriptase
MYKALKAGYRIEGTPFDSEIGTPQGSIMSPILANILLNKFDTFMAKYQEQFNKGATRRLNPEYRRL